MLRLNRASAQIIVGETTGLRVPIDAIHYLKEDGTESETQGENYIPGRLCQIRQSCPFLQDRPRG